METVCTLRRAGFETLWAGGCVRDHVLGKLPKDYDLASTATPDDVIRIFGRRRTVAVGASFGVVMVQGPDKAAGQIEVATFRSDGDYLDGRRPSSVMFCRPEEDARRRDFTINGMFFDPIDETVIDYVGGREDLAAGIVRAIGDPIARFTEDKLRMLRAVRFAATFGFALDPATAAAVYHLRQQISQISEERIAQELKRMLSHETRAHSFRLLIQTGLFIEVFPELNSEASGGKRDAELTLMERTLHYLISEQFEPAMALMLRSLHQPSLPPPKTAKIEAICRRLKLSNDEVDAICWLAESLPILSDIPRKPLHVRKPLLDHPYFEWLLQMSAAIAAAENRVAFDVDFCRNYVSSLRGSKLCPLPLVDGQDLKARHVPEGPVFRVLLTKIRNEQLDEILTNRATALERLNTLIAESQGL